MSVKIDLVSCTLFLKIILQMTNCFASVRIDLLSSSKQKMLSNLTFLQYLRTPTYTRVTLFLPLRLCKNFWMI
jgi:hypothetical protein